MAAERQRSVEPREAAKWQKPRQRWEIRTTTFRPLLQTEDILTTQKSRLLNVREGPSSASPDKHVTKQEYSRGRQHTANGSAAYAGCSSTPRTATPSSTANRRRAFGRPKLGTCARSAATPPLRGAGPSASASRSTSGSASPRPFNTNPHRLAALVGEGAGAAPREPLVAHARVAAVRARAAARRRAPRARTGGADGPEAGAAAADAHVLLAAGVAAGGVGGGRRPLAMALDRRAGGVGGGARRAFDLTMAVGSSKAQRQCARKCSWGWPKEGETMRMTGYHQCTRGGQREERHVGLRHGGRLPRRRPPALLKSDRKGSYCDRSADYSQMTWG